MSAQESAILECRKNIYAAIQMRKRTTSCAGSETLGDDFMRHLASNGFRSDTKSRWITKLEWSGFGKP